GERAFDFCENLREVYDKSQLRVGELSKIENGDITKYVKTEDIHYTDDYTSKVSVHEESGCILYSDGDTVELIGIRDTVEHVIIPEGVTTISSYVFYKTRVIKTLSIAKSVTTIMPYAFASRCETHDEKGHSHENCDFPLKTIIFLNAEGWRATSLYGDEPVFFNAIDLTADPMGAWSKLVLSEYAEWQWVSVE
ncbi:MAG: leucine-rich repeat protein, partial [Clostridia bacterium]|nr:leucine-rich repeat protein [Clostridia bacterium]